MRVICVFSVFLLVLAGCAGSDGDDSPGISARLSSSEAQGGFVDLYWDESEGRLLLGIRQLEMPLLYQSSLARGVGSNDLGLDRGQLGSTKIVEFQRIGRRVLLVENNLDYRARSDSPDETKAVAESFARSVIWGFEVSGTHDGAVIVDATEFLLRDSHGIGAQLADAGEGTYAVDASHRQAL